MISWYTALPRNHSPTAYNRRAKACMPWCLSITNVNALACPGRKMTGLSTKLQLRSWGPGEYAKHNLETKLIGKGDYLYIDIPDFMNNIPGIGAAFQELIHHEDIAPDGFCIEWYFNNDLCRCMVRAK